MVSSVLGSAFSRLGPQACCFISDSIAEVSVTRLQHPWVTGLCTWRCVRSWRPQICLFGMFLLVTTSLWWHFSLRRTGRWWRCDGLSWQLPAIVLASTGMWFQRLCADPGTPTQVSSAILAVLDEDTRLTSQIQRICAGILIGSCYTSKFRLLLPCFHVCRLRVLPLLSWFWGSSAQTCSLTGPQIDFKMSVETFVPSPALTLNPNNCLHFSRGWTLIPLESNQKRRL